MTTLADEFVPRATHGGYVDDEPQKDREDCRHGAACHSFSCNYSHPRNRVAKCRYGKKCYNQDCAYLHHAWRSNKLCKHLESSPSSAAPQTTPASQAYPAPRMKDQHREVRDQPVDGVPLRMTRPSSGRNKKEAMWKQNHDDLSNRINYPVAQLPCWYQMNPRALHRLEGIPNFDDESRSFLEGCALTESQLVHIANRFQELLKNGLPNPSAWLVAFAGSLKKASNFQMDEINQSTETPHCELESQSIYNFRKKTNSDHS